MKKLLVVLALSLSLSGCAGIAERSIGLPSGTLTASVQNPVTKATLYRIENGLIVAVTALNSYKKLCNDGSLPVSCVAVVQRMQGYVHQARPLIRSLRTFVRKNDQVNAAVVLATLRDVLTQVYGEANAAGIPIPVSNPGA